MYARRIYPLLAAVLLLAAGCGDSRSPMPTQPLRPTDPNFLIGRQLDAYNEAYNVLAPKLFPSGLLLFAAQAQLRAIKADVDATPPRLEGAKLRAWAFIFYAGALYKEQKLLNPTSAATKDNLIRIICDVSIIASLKLEATVCPLNGSTLGVDGKISFVNTNDDVPDVVVTETKSVALSVPPDNGNLLVTLSRYADDQVLQTVYRALAPKWRVAVSPVPTIAPDAPDAEKFRLGMCVMNEADSPFRPKEIEEGYLRVVHINSLTKAVDVPDPAEPLAENSGCAVGPDQIGLGPDAGLLTRFASRTMKVARSFASLATSPFRPTTLHARARTLRFDVGGVGALLFDMHSDFDIGLVFPDLRFKVAPSITSTGAIVPGGSVSVSSWEVRNVQQQSLNANQPLRKSLEAVPAGQAPGDVAAVHVHRDPVTGAVITEDPLRPVRHGYYLSVDDKLDDSDIHLANTDASESSTSRASLFAGGSAVVDANGRTLQIPSETAAGQYYILVVIDDKRVAGEGEDHEFTDARGQVPEIEPLAGNGNTNGEGNNVHALAITVAPDRVPVTLTFADPASLVRECNGPSGCGQAFVQDGYVVQSFWYDPPQIPAPHWTEAHLHAQDLGDGNWAEAHHFQGDGARQGVRIRRQDGQAFSLEGIDYRDASTPFEIGTTAVASITPPSVDGYTAFPVTESSSLQSLQISGFSNVTEVWITMAQSGIWDNIRVSGPRTILLATSLRLQPTFSAAKSETARRHRVVGGTDVLEP
jgi:hypothetical protein